MATLQDIREQHQPKYSKRRTGMGAISGRPLSAWSVKCSCGWEHKTNQNKASVESDWKLHTRETWEAQRHPVIETATPATPAAGAQDPSKTAAAFEPGMGEFLAWQRRQELVKPCPCCGDKANWRMGNLRDQKRDEVECLGCGLIMRGDFDAESALTKWNLRVSAA